ncbi:hypothetical protein RRG08_028765 [Elysia crispata]|uniref:Sodium/nucleoside cotransporter n=1 Tax=Elysia crispata TaxID=231223 RepID=A0AAE1DIK7_9GAST|nr:hypothetical protein RRG08_028765 [Elysia crispata]
MKSNTDYPSQTSYGDGADIRFNGGEASDTSGSLLGKQRPSGLLKPKESLEMTIVVEKAPIGGSNECLHTQKPEERPSWTVHVERLENSVRGFWTKHKRRFTFLIRCLAILAYLVYFIYCMKHRFGDEGSFTLIGWTVLLLLAILYRVFSGRCGCCGRLASFLTLSARWRIKLRYGLYAATVLGLGTYLGFSVFTKHPQNVQSLLGIFGIIAVGFLLSQQPSKVKWHPVFWGFVLQFCFAILTMQTNFGYQIFMWLGDSVQRLLYFSNIGSAFVLGQNFRSMGLAFGYAGGLIFFGSLMGLMIHYGVVGFIVVRGGRALSVVMGTGPVESVIAVANIFIGLSSAPLLVLPYLATMSKSELGALMTCGYASVSGEILALFIASGAPANHLLTAAIISAPAALAVAKLLMPETEEVDLTQQTGISAEGIGGDQNQNALSAASDGALVAMRLSVSAMVNMLAFVSLLSLIDGILEFLGERAGFHGLTFDAICGYVLFPLAFAMGAPYEDCSRVGSLIGVKLFATPVIGYADLGKIIDNRRVLEEYVSNGNGTWRWEGTDIILDSTNTTLVHGIMSEKAEVITTYAMCGFSAFTAIGISIGALTSLCPSRKVDIIRLVPLAFLGGNLASFATGAVAGLLFIPY